MENLGLLIGFNLGVLFLLALDLGVLHRHAHAVSLREAALWSGIWIALSLLFNLLIFITLGKQPALEFLTGYLIEKSLSVDNIFVFVLLFSYFRVPAAYQHRVLFWGILGALVMRGLMIALGSVLLEQFHWVIYLFGAFLVFTGVRMAIREEEEVHPEHNPVTRLVRRLVHVAPDYVGSALWVRQAGKLAATPLFVVLLVIETTDLVFALDSIPAIFGVTQNAFIVYTSNVCAILGLRALYFLLAGMVTKFHYLRLGLSAVLTFVGLKMLGGDLVEIPIAVSLGVIAAILAIAVLASLVRERGQRMKQDLKREA